jgi:hypothetical protein
MRIEGQRKEDILYLHSFIQRVCGLPPARKKILTFVNPYAGTYVS